MSENWLILDAHDFTFLMRSFWKLLAFKIAIFAKLLIGLVRNSDQNLIWYYFLPTLRINVASRRTTQSVRPGPCPTWIWTIVRKQIVINYSTDGPKLWKFMKIFIPLRVIIWSPATKSHFGFMKCYDLWFDRCRDLFWDFEVVSSQKNKIIHLINF